MYNLEMFEKKVVFGLEVFHRCTPYLNRLVTKHFAAKRSSEENQFIIKLTFVFSTDVMGAPFI